MQLTICFRKDISQSRNPSNFFAFPHHDPFKEVSYLNHIDNRGDGLHVKRKQAIFNCKSCIDFYGEFNDFLVIRI